MSRVFSRADILLPNEKTDLSKWSVIACDQHTSEPEYWHTLADFISDAPSALNLILPEAFLSAKNDGGENISCEMRRYIDAGLFRQISQSYIYVERVLRSGHVRKGIVGQIDLERYDWKPDSNADVRASEQTVTSRIPARVDIRSKAFIELPHVMVFFNDPENTVFSSADKSCSIYDFDLNMDGGHIRGFRLNAEAADRIDAAFDSLSCRLFAVGDGNHSLAAAKQYWENIKVSLSGAELKTHPARYALVEMVNIYDDSIVFEPIHRILCETDENNLMLEANSFFSGYSGQGYSIRLSTSHETEVFSIDGFLPMGKLIALCEEFCLGYLEKHGGKIDYIHGESTALSLGSRPGCAALLLPSMDKASLFDSISTSGSMPRKSFSMGNAEDKRYYLEAKRIR